MSRFALEEFTIVKGPICFYKMKVDGVCLIDDFWSEIKQEGNLKSQLYNAIAIMERYALGLRLPPNKFKMISTQKDPLNQFEVKTNDLRIYLFRDSGGAVVVCAGKKSSQRKDITRFKNLVKEYYKTHRV